MLYPSLDADRSGCEIVGAAPSATGLTLLTTSATNKNKGVSYAPIPNRTKFRRATQCESNRRHGSLRGKRRRRHPVAVLLSQRRQEEDLLPVRGAQPRSHP